MFGPAVAQADPGSLYSGPGPRPGPDILYAPLADAPQLDNAPGSIWHAPPILISGASAYRAGEFLYQDFLYDDHGAKQQRDPNDQRQDPGGNSADGDIFSIPNGTYTYPTNPRYANNAADLVELRVKPEAAATAFRVTLNTLEDPSLVGFSIAIGGTPGVTHSFPFGANVVAPARLFLTVHGTTAALTDAVTGHSIGGPAPTVSVDLLRRQFEVSVPHSSWDPSGQVVRLAAAVGLWDNANDRYLLPQGSADATHPGGVGNAASPAAFFNVAFRYNGQEPMPAVATPGSLADAAWWRDQAQGHALAAGDISPFFADVDFNKLAAHVNDDMPGQPAGVPRTGAFDRILASHFETKQGADYSVACGVSSGCKGELTGRLQPYAIYVPSKPIPARGFGLTLLLHSLSANYNQYLGSHNQSQFGDRGPGSIVITAEGRGPDGWYYDYAGADTFEMWADAAAHYRLNPDATDIAGYSMGGYATYKFSSQFPDLFARAQPTVGPPGLGVWLPPLDPAPGGPQSNTNRMLASVRNIPFLIWNEVSDELVPYAGVVAQANTFDLLGYRYEFDSFTAGEHLTLAINDQFAPAASFLGTDLVDRNPAHIDYVYNPTMDFPAVGTAAGHAYWLSGLKLRDATGAAPLGSIDVRSQGFGVADPLPLPTQRGAGVLQGGTLGVVPYVSQSRGWAPATPAPARDALDITTRNISTLTIDPTRAHVDCHVALRVAGDGPLLVHLQGCGAAKSFGGNTTRTCRHRRSLTLSLRHPRGARITRAVVFVNGRHVTTARAHGAGGLRRVRIRTPVNAATLRVTIRLRYVLHGRVHSSTQRHTYSGCAPRRRRRA